MAHNVSDERTIVGVAPHGGEQYECALGQFFHHNPEIAPGPVRVHLALRRELPFNYPGGELRWLRDRRPDRRVGGSGGRQAVLAAIAAEVAEEGKVTGHALRMFAEHRISKAAFDEAAARGMRHARARK